ncbi:permease [Alkalihalobacterium chitinilyticum]|uniref:Permease n=1 Tax=Alkalihalobacterium chitinilyticum TaxID=2980103 RepID=A0ABT5V9G7_9BACI|nr:permease [Alkalihalobacterium chitinilyticum]MDE5412090.1 permease [Alkalihalobacterium chitinilyticum]
MQRSTNPYLVEITGFILLALVSFLIFYSPVLAEHGQGLPASLLIFNTIFLSILIEAIPFVLIGVFIAGLIQVFITEEHIRRWIPKNRVLAVVASCFIGALFPACECGIVPIVRRLVAKGVPIFAGVGFLLTGPLINPIVVGSTYMAFGNDLRMALLRMVLGLVIALIICAVISMLYKGSQFRRSHATMPIESSQKLPLFERLKSMCQHSVDEFFEMGKYLMIGALLAAFIQTYVSSASLLGLGEGILMSTVVMMGLAFLLSLCSEADAFIAASFRHLFPQTSLLGFLIYGPMLDLKNSLMLLAVFRFRFVIVLMLLITVTVLGVLMIAHPFL